MKKSKFLSLLAVAVLICGLVGCQSDNVAIEQGKLIDEVNRQTATVSKQASQDIETETTMLIRTGEKSTELTTKEFSEKIALSREYEFDLEKYIEKCDKNSWRIRDELDFLSDEQYDTYIRALIFIDETEYFIIPDTCKTPTHYIDENGELRDFYIEFEGYADYYYVSTYQSFYEYLQSIFTQEAVDEIMADKRFKLIGDELYYEWGEKGGPIFFQGGKYQLVEKNDNEISFEYIAYQKNDETEWTEVHPIKLVRTDNGWRSELFDYLQAES